MSGDYFAVFDLPRHLSIDLKDLEKRFYALSRKWHPDLFARKSEKEREESLDATALLNDAYRTLKDPIARATYLLKLEGFDIGERGTKDVPPELLEEVFELNMALEEGEQGEISQMRTRFETMKRQIDSDLERQFGAGELNEIRALLNRRKYITNLIDRTNVSDRI